jgi:hypothetical protein
LILTDSSGNPRSFPKNDATQLEETYPYILREKLNGSTFWQLSYGNVATEQLCSQAIGYLNHWEPDVIIMQSGLNDCRPEAFSEFQKTVINRFSGPLFRYIKKYVFHPMLIKRRQVYRISERSFRKTLKKVKLIFPQSKIYWLEICAGSGYEEIRPGVNKRMEDYNKIIKEIYGNDLVPILEKIISENGFNVDCLHWNKNGHRVVAEILIEKITSSLKESA